MSDVDRHLLFRSLTMTPGIMKPLKVAEPPRLPNVRQCCINRGITDEDCMHAFCDARNAKSAKVGVSICFILILGRLCFHF